MGNGTDVRLAYAYPFSYAVSGMSWDLTYVHAHVRNNGPAEVRRVYIHRNTGTAWEDVEMSLEQEYGTHSLYVHQLPWSREEFVLRYENSEGTSWDNNGWNNYKVQAWVAPGEYESGAVGRGVALGEAQIDRHDDRGSGTTQYILKGKIHVENLSYHKLVGLRMNIGGVWQDVYASYSHSFSTGGGDNIEEWTFGEFGRLIKSHPIIHPDPPFPPFQFAAFYHNLGWGTSYWDNNFRQDYVITHSGEQLR